MGSVIPPAAPLPNETCPGVATFDASVPHRPGNQDWNGAALQNATVPPNPGTMLTAALMNAIMAQLTAYGAVVPNARVSVVAGSPPSFAFVTGSPTWVQTLLAAGFVCTRNAAGDYSITWAAPSGTTTWAASTAYTSGHFVVPPNANGFYYKCTTSGTSGATLPLFPLIVGNTVTDGGAVWTCWGTVNAFPAPVSQPSAHLNLASGLASAEYAVSAVNITNGVRVTTSLNGALTDLNFSVDIF
jgi:hypothetical protein